MMLCLSWLGGLFRVNCVGERDSPPQTSGLRNSWAACLVLVMLQSFVAE
jgi:hypothetical protein